MAITTQLMEEAFKDMGLTVQQDGNDYVHTTEGNYAPLLHSVVTLDEDGSGVTVLTALADSVSDGKRSAVCELLNQVHGQNLWNVRFHLDETGRVFSAGRLMLWGRPFNPVQFGDIFFSMLVSTDRLFPCLKAIEEGASVPEAFEKFFLVDADD